MFLVALCILLSTGFSLHQESCMYRVAILQNKDVFCFNKMGNKYACSKEHPNCRSEERNGLICFKWIDVELTCYDNNLNKVPIENQTCGKDQESLDCAKEFPNTLTPVVSSVGTKYHKGGFIPLLWKISILLLGLIRFF